MGLPFIFKLKTEVDVNSTDNAGRTVLKYSAKHWRTTQYLKMIVQRRDFKNFDVKGEFGRTLLSHVTSEDLHEWDPLSYAQDPSSAPRYHEHDDIRIKYKVPKEQSNQTSPGLTSVLRLFRCVIDDTTVHNPVF